MSDYSQTIKAIIQQTETVESALPLKNEACRSQFFFHPHPTAKVCLFLHGFTAGPYQFEPIGKAFYQEGYNVLIPLQPGHGQAGDWNRDCPPPLPTDIQVYQQFALEWLQIARAALQSPKGSLSKQVIVGGLSSGATLAAWLAVDYPQYIEKTLLFAPYLGSKLAGIDWLVRRLPCYYEWPNKDDSGNFGYKGFRFPALKLFLNLGREILSRASEMRTAPMLVIASESDRAVSRHKQQTLFKSVLQHQPQSWYYCFDKSFQIHHRMMTRLEGNDFQNLVIALAKAYVKSQITWEQLQQLAHQMLQGTSWTDSVRDLNLTLQVAPELEVIMTTSLRVDRFKCLSLH